VEQLPDPEEVTVLDAVYDWHKQLMVWGVELQNGDRYPMIWKRSEIREAFQQKYEPPEAHIVELCERMLGKKINIIVIRDKHGNPIPKEVAEAVRSA
jgi:hypothetical protein